MTMRLLGMFSTAGIVIAAGVSLASPASAHEVPPIENPDPLNVLSNTGNGLDFLLNNLQHGHVNAPLLGLAPAIANPVPYVTTHVIPVGIETVERIGAISPENHEPGEEPEDPGHEH
jgi:hypothetical protein